MPSSIIAPGISGIAAAEAEIAATEANIANASNPNYSAESVTLVAEPGAQGQGIGVNILGTGRAQAPFLSGQINLEQASQNYQQTLSQSATLAQNYISPSGGTDLSGYLQDLFNAFSTLAAAPADPSARTAALTAAGNFAQATTTLSGGLEQTNAAQLAQIPALVAQVNTLDTQVAALNAQIQSAQGTSGSAAALEDQRDGLVQQLAGLIGASADASGNVSVGGVPLVSGTSALTLATTGAGVNVGLEVTLSQGNLPVETSQTGGTIGGIFGSVATIAQAQSSVNNFATTAANAINAVYQTGYGLDGSTGNQLFQVSASTTSPITLNPSVTVQNLAAASSAAGVPGDGSNAAALAALATTPNLGAPGETLGQSFTAIAADFGTTAANAAANQQQATTTLNSLQQLKGSITGISLNDQLTNLVQYQNALEAAGRAVQAANDVTSYLLQITSN